jgi:hypothetical protein
VNEKSQLNRFENRSPKFRIFHVDDEWILWRSLPNRLFDHLYGSLAKGLRNQLDCDERLNPNGRLNSYEFRAFDKKTNDCYFSYLFVTNLGAEKYRFSPTDVFVLDVMRKTPDRSGDILSSINSEIALLRSLGVAPDNCRYFSTSVDGLRPLPCPGFQKIEYVKLVRFLFERLTLKLSEAKMGLLNEY